MTQDLILRVHAAPANPHSFVVVPGNDRQQWRQVPWWIEHDFRHREEVREVSNVVAIEHLTIDGVMQGQVHPLVLGTGRRLFPDGSPFTNSVSSTR